MKNRIFISLCLLALAAPSLSTALNRPASFPQKSLSQAQDAQAADEFVKRLKDERFSPIYGGAVWTLIHDYKDHKHIKAILGTLYPYLQAMEQYEQDKGAALRQAGGVKQFKDQLAIWLEDDEQSVRAFAAVMLGVSGDRAYAPRLAKLLKRKEQGDLIYDRGRAALALGLLQAKEYGKDLVTLLSSRASR